MLYVLMHKQELKFAGQEGYTTNLKKAVCFTSIDQANKKKKIGYRVISYGEAKKLIQN